MKEISITRKELYDLVWSEPIVSIAKRHLMLDYDLRKVCAKMNIPLPPSGYWSKLRAGKPVSIEKFPDTHSGDQEIKFFIREEGDKEDIVFQSPEAILRTEIENNLNLPLIVPSKLTNPDKLIVAYKINLEKKEGYNYFRDVLDVRVSQENLGRALRFMDTFIKLLRARGHNIIIRNGETHAIVEEQEMKISLMEKSKRVVIDTKPWTRTELQSTGVIFLKVRIFYTLTNEWIDGKIPIENMLSKIVAKMEIKGKERKEEHILWAKEREKQEEKKLIRLEYEQRKENELNDFKQLLKKAKRWRQAKMLRDYINSIELNTALTHTTTEELKQWIEWARRKADWYDPNIEIEDELLKDIDRDTLIYQRKSSGFYD